LIANDVGWFRIPGPGGQLGVCIDPEHLLVLEPRPFTPRPAMSYANVWLVDIEVKEMTVDFVRLANKSVARQAPNEIYGPTEASLLAHSREMAKRASKSLPEGMWGESRMLRRCDQEVWHFLVEMAQPPDERPRISFEEAFERITPPTKSWSHNATGNTGFSEEEEQALRVTERRLRAAELERIGGLIAERTGSIVAGTEIVPAPKARGEHQ